METAQPKDTETFQTFQTVINKIMGNIPSYLQPPSVFTQCIRKRKTSYSQQLIDIDSDYDFGDEEIIYKLEKKKNTTRILNDHQFLYLLKI